KALPWKDVRFLAPFLGMLFFIPGGIGVIMNGSHQLNTVVHNTIWVTGHCHLTVAGAVILAFFGIAHWLIPHLTGRKLTPQINRLGIIQAVLWTIGMTIMSRAMHIAGLLGAPRRSSFSEYAGGEQVTEWIGYQVAQAVGGSILFIAILLIGYNVIKMAFFAPKGEEEYPLAEEEEDAEPTPAFFENWKLWIAITLA